MNAVGNSRSSELARLRLAIRGAVQGVGFRPFVHCLAQQLGLAGWVNNSPQGVCVEVEGERQGLEQFLHRLGNEKPPRSFIQSLEATWLDAVHYSGFEIRESETGGERTALVLPDVATCPDCLREIFDPANRRHRYPFTNCTQCGPRFSIITALPYDRANTSMKAFTMCPACQAEYDDPADRRFHAQPNACPVCGPRLEFWSGQTSLLAEAALLGAAETIRGGRVVAVKGIGGFHLVVDARNDEAVRRLRERKQREEKPFALLFPALESVKALCGVGLLEERLLCSPEAPIVLLGRKPAGDERDRQGIAPSVAPGNPSLGVMLPSNPLQHLLMAELGFPVVATSGNLSDEPICTDEDEARERLGGIADAFLVHDRPIVRHVDDAIARVMLDREVILRRARGYAPLPITLKAETRNPKAEVILGVGAHLKNSVALSVGNQVFVSQHIGDLENEPAHTAFRRVIADFEKLYDVQPSVIASDLHPDYLSTRFAEEVTGKPGNPSPTNGVAQCSALPLKVGVQHHVAHVLSCMAENELQPPALGVAWDGTGYGLDGTIWGGEFFLVTGDEVRRVGHLRSFALPGGDAAVKEPRRSAMGLLYELAGGDGNRLLQLAQEAALGFSQKEQAAVATMLARGINAPRCSSVGRLFDAVAALVQLRQCIRFEGQAAMELEFALEGVKTEEAYSMRLLNPKTDEMATSASQPRATTGSELNRGGTHAALGALPVVLDWAPMVEGILADIERGLSAGAVAMKFHNALAAAVVAVARHVGETRVVLSGGCFQNRYLTERTVAGLRAAGFQPYWHQRVPPNDGGVSLGQIVAARRATR